MAAIKTKLINTLMLAMSFVCPCPGFCRDKLFSNLRSQALKLPPSQGFPGGLICNILLPPTAA